MKYAFRVRLVDWSGAIASVPHWRGREVMEDGSFFVVANDFRDALLVVIERSESPAILGVELVGPVWVSEEEEER